MTTMLTVEEGLSQDLDDILADAGNPVFVRSEDPGRIYRLQDGSFARLHVIESETAIVEHRWYKLAGLPKTNKKVIAPVRKWWLED